MIVKGGVCTKGCDERQICVRVWTPLYYLRATGMMGAGGDESCSEVQRRGGGGRAAETNAQVDP